MKTKHWFKKAITVFLTIAMVVSTLPTKIVEVTATESRGNEGWSEASSTNTVTFDDVMGINPLSSTEANYAHLLQLALYFFDANMCGPDVETRSAFAWRQNCHLQDMNIPLSDVVFEGSIPGMPSTLDLSGGFHDAGDHIKFNLPILFGGVTLGWSVQEYRAEFERIGSMPHAQRILNHFAEYVRRCIIRNPSGTIIAYAYQVARGNDDVPNANDHGFWGAPHLQTGTQQGARRRAWVTNLTSQNPGTDQVAMAAAFLAINYAVSGNPVDLAYARELFAWANTASHRGVAIRGHSPFYHSSRWEDKMALAGEMLVIATGNNSYRTSASVAHSNWPYVWDDVWPLVGVLRGDTAAVNSRFGSWVNSPNTYHIFDNWGNARMSAGMQGLGLAWDNLHGSGRSGVRSTWARGQMDFILGQNSYNTSFVLGYPTIGTGTPTYNNMQAGVSNALRIHHRAASTNTISWNAHNDNLPPANLLTGGLIGGPGNGRQFINVMRGPNYQHTEGAIDYNANLVFAAAGHLRQHPTHQPVPISQIPGNFRHIDPPPNCPDCDAFPCVCPCDGCGAVVCICCPDCNVNPCVCPPCPDCNNRPCTCPQRCPMCDNLPHLCDCPLYCMQIDDSLGLFGGQGSGQQSTHSLLRSHGANRAVSGTAPNRTITITNRGGTSQGVDIILQQLNTRPGYSYRFELSGRVIMGAGPHDMFFRAVSGPLEPTAGTAGDILVQTSTATNADFNLTHTATHEQIATHISQNILRYRFGGAGGSPGPRPDQGQDFVVTGIRIIEFPTDGGGSTNCDVCGNPAANCTCPVLCSGCNNPIASCTCTKAIHSVELVTCDQCNITTIVLVTRLININTDAVIAERRAVRKGHSGRGDCCVLHIFNSTV
ncbi:MAG: glycoside hydrolase family 9 protein [Oscillospiraceae bacterium]|nr:glycoside hydrolase family 9 protein [Oscillospiraceae bacterium]